MKILTLESSMLKRKIRKVAEPFSYIPKERSQNDCWLHLRVNSTMHKLSECVSVSFTFLKGLEFSTLPVLSEHGLIRVRVNSYHVAFFMATFLYLITALTPFLAVQQNWTIPSMLSEVAVLDGSPHFNPQLFFSAALPLLNGYAGTSGQVTALPGKCTWS